jgi:hypothetical protein
VNSRVKVKLRDKYGSHVVSLSRHDAADETGRGCGPRSRRSQAAPPENPATFLEYYGVSGFRLYVWRDAVSLGRQARAERLDADLHIMYKLVHAD